jgi:hypothetical protein
VEDEEATVTASETSQWEPMDDEVLSPPLSSTPNNEDEDLPEISDISDIVPPDGGSSDEEDGAHVSSLHWDEAWDYAEPYSQSPPLL